MKPWLPLLLSACASLAQAQSFDWNRVWSSCSAEASAFDANVRGTELSARGVQNFVQEAIGSPPTEAKMRTKMAEDRAVLASPQYDVTTKLATRLALCGTMAAQRQLEAGATRTTQTPPPVRSDPQPQNETGEDSLRCVKGLAADSALFNGCRMGVNLVWCAVPREGRTPRVNCEAQEFSPADLSPGDRTSVEENFQIAWTMCDAPAHPVKVRYIAGRGLEGKCRR